jgi:uncharacterized protein
MSEIPAYLLIDGENIDMTLGQMILNGRPRPDQRPRWERVMRMVEERWQRPAKGLFFINGSRGLPWPFITALRSIGLTPIPLGGTPEQKVVDIGILRTLEALRERPGDVMLVSHDKDFAAAMHLLVGPERRLGLLAFEEYIAGELREIPGLEILDLEYHAGAFESGPLPRLRVIPIDEFDPNRYL